MNCHLARMSDGVIRNLGPVKSGKGLKHHECRGRLYSVLCADFCPSDGAAASSRHIRARCDPRTPQLAKILKSGALDGVLRQSKGNLRKVRNFDKSILARERERSVAALGLGDTENSMIAGVIDRDGAPVVDHQSPRVRENRVSKIVLSTHRTRSPQSGRPPVRGSRH
jgi:hypothetical protein